MPQQCEANTRSGQQCKKTCEGRTCHIHSLTDSCSVCLSVMNDTNSRILDCGHKFHSRCIDRWKRRSSTCPMCRAPFDQPMYTVKISIEPIGYESERVTSNIQSLMNVFGLDNSIDQFFTDIRFTVMTTENLHEILNEIGFGFGTLPGSNISSIDTIS